MTGYQAASADSLAHDGPEDRGGERWRRINRTAATAASLRVVTLLSSLVSVPLTLKYLGPERYGIWVAMSSINTLLAFTDFGAGYGLMNRVARGTGTGDAELIRRSVSSTFFALLLVTALLLVGAACLYPLVPWQSGLHTRTTADGIAAGRAVAVMVTVFLLTTPFATVQRVQFAYQEGFQSQLWQIGGVLAGLVGLVAVISRKGDLWMLALASTAGPFLAVCLNWVDQFYRKRPWLRPRRQSWELRTAKEVIADGGFFLILQLAGTVVLSIDSLLIVHWFGPVSLTEYSLVARLYQIAPALGAVWFAPLWPAYAEAIARGDARWARKSLSSSTGLATACSALIAITVSFSIRPLVLLWTHTAIKPSTWLITGFAVCTVIQTGTSAIAAYLNGSNYIRGQAVLVIIQAALSVVLKVVLSRFIGSAAIVWGTSLAFMLSVIPAYAYLVPKLLARHSEPGGGVEDRRIARVAI
jgi:O-antigen/teichoic acid export membrane protein